MHAWNQLRQGPRRPGLHDRHPRRALRSNQLQRATASARWRWTHRSISAQEHDTPSFAKWHKILEGFGSDLLSAYPPECKVIDEFFIKTTAGKPNGQDAVLAGLVFETSGLKAVKKFLGEGKNEIFQQGRKDGWLTGKWRENYFACSDFRGPGVGPRKSEQAK